MVTQIKNQALKNHEVEESLRKIFIRLESELSKAVGRMDELYINTSDFAVKDKIIALMLDIEHAHNSLKRIYNGES